ncbi:hypothetical protein Scep_011264 [Stephania cephalantha]|uniref:Plus3 domain-containing protein n=1 Tax=Stephania cephalantha TaxID=152367 RepID=A0AAP0JCR9_9MAGN
MADLENLLLEAAGRTGSSRNHRHSRPQSRRQREGSYSDDGSDSKDELSDEDHGYPNRKPSGSQIPLKKRERDDDRGSRDDDDDGEEGDERGGGGGGSRDSRDSGEESDVGSDLYKDEYDREQLAQMTELEREMILSDRAQRRDDQRLTERVRAKQSVKKAPPLKEMATPVSGASRVRSSARSAERASAKDDALNELRAKRMKQQDQEGFRRTRDARDGRDGAAANRDRDRDSSPLKRGRSSVAVASVSSESSDSESGSESSRSRDEGSAGNDELGESDEEKSSGKDALSIEDIKTVTIRRSKLAKWLLEPFFEEVVVGCFVRLGIGKDRNDNSIYRLCKVLNIDASDPDKQYVLEGKSTNKYLHVIFGKSEARWQMDRVSNSPPLEKEFKEWVAQMEKTGAHMPSKSELAEKQEAIQKAITYVYSAATVKQMLHEKKTASTRPLNVAAEKARLRRELEKAQSKQNGAEIDRIQTRLQELEKISREKDVKAVRLEEMNKRNRAENFKNASEMKPVNTSLKAVRRDMIHSLGDGLGREIIMYRIVMELMVPMNRQMGMLPL